MGMLGENWKTIENNSMIGPLIDGQFLVSYCEARSGRPKPNVKWYVDGKALAGEFIVQNFILFHFNCFFLFVCVLLYLLSLYTHIEFFEIRPFNSQALKSEWGY